MDFYATKIGLDPIFSLFIKILITYTYSPISQLQAK